MRPASWITRRVGNIGYVLEIHRDTNGEIVERFNFELPANQVPAFIEGRKRVIAIVHDRWNPDVLDDDTQMLIDSLGDPSA